MLAADPAGLTLFAAWRTMPMPEDGPGARAAVVAKLLREYRSGAHLLAIRAGGLTPLEALLASDEGESAAVAYGWQPPFPPFEPLLRRRIRADLVTDRIVGEAYQSLDVAERGELVRLFDEAVKHLRAAAVP